MVGLFLRRVEAGLGIVGFLKFDLHKIEVVKVFPV